MRESRQHLADNIVHGQGSASTSEDPLDQRAAGGTWQLRLHEKDFEVHTDVTSNIRNLLAETAAHTSLNDVQQQLQKERPPQKGHLEEMVMSWLEPSADHNVSIGILPKDSPETTDVRTAYHKLPKNSIVRQIATNFTTGMYENIAFVDKENIHYIFADLILQQFWSYQLNPNILMPASPPIVAAEPVLSEHIMQAARAICPNAPASVPYGNLDLQPFLHT